MDSGDVAAGSAPAVIRLSTELPPRRSYNGWHCCCCCYLFSLDAFLFVLVFFVPTPLAIPSGRLAEPGRRERES